MAASGHDSLGARRELKVGAASYDYFSLERAASQLGDASRLPYSLKVLFENLLRHEDGRSVTVDHLKALVGWLRARRSDQEIAYRPARVLMQDFTGVPAVVDLAAMRQAMLDLGGDPQRINPLSPVDLIIDHSVQVDVFGNPTAFQRNVELEYQRNGERYAFLRWGALGVRQFPGGAAGHRHLPPGQPRISGAGGLDRGRGQPAARLPRHAGRHRQPHHDDQWPGRARLGGRRHRGRGGDARPADLDADPGGGRVQADRPAARGGDRDRPGAHRDRDAAQEGRGRQVRRVLRRRPRPSAARRSRHHRQHGARSMARPAASSRSTGSPWTISG